MKNTVPDNLPVIHDDQKALPQVPPEFSEKQSKALITFLLTLRKIAEDLMAEGYTYENGEVIPPKQD